MLMRGQSACERRLRPRDTLSGEPGRHQLERMVAGPLTDEHVAGDDAALGLPPIILFVADDHDMVDMYSTYFAAQGMWIATAVTPSEGLSTIEELRPNLIISDIGFSGEATGISFVRLLKERADTCQTPLIVLTGLPIDELPDHMREAAELFLRKPIAPQVLLSHTRRILESSETLRGRAQPARGHVGGVAIAMTALDTPGGRLSENGIGRYCPNCGGGLDWIERARIDGQAFDYYRWCERGCGLYCLAVSAGSWTKLA